MLRKPLFETSSILVLLCFGILSVVTLVCGDAFRAAVCILLAAALHMISVLPGGRDAPESTLNHELTALTHLIIFIIAPALLIFRTYVLLTTWQLFPLICLLLLTYIICGTLRLAQTVPFLRSSGLRSHLGVFSGSLLALLALLAPSRPSVFLSLAPPVLLSLSLLVVRRRWYPGPQRQPAGTPPQT